MIGPSGFNGENEKIYLKGNTIISGNITCQSNQRIIYKAINASISGSVSGAKIENK